MENYIQKFEVNCAEMFLYETLFDGRWYIWNITYHRTSCFKGEGGVELTCFLHLSSCDSYLRNVSVP
jgi:hypothetical protein